MQTQNQISLLVVSALNLKERHAQPVCLITHLESSLHGGNINFPLRNPALKSLQLTCAAQRCSVLFIRAIRTKQIALSFICPATLLGHILNGGAVEHWLVSRCPGVLYQVFLVPTTAKLSGHSDLISGQR